jgi:peptide chain release factor 1
VLQVMEGDLDEVIHALQVARGTELLAELEQRNGL